MAAIMPAIHIGYATEHCPSHGLHGQAAAFATTMGVHIERKNL